MDKKEMGKKFAEAMQGCIELAKMQKERFLREVKEIEEDSKKDGTITIKAPKRFEPNK